MLGKQDVYLADKIAERNLAIVGYITYKLIEISLRVTLSYMSELSPARKI